MQAEQTLEDYRQKRARDQLEIARQQRELAEAQGKPLEYINGLIQTEMNYLKQILAVETDTVEKLRLRTEIQELQNELTENQNKLLEDQSNLTDGLTDAQKELVKSLEKQIKLGILSEVNVSDVSNIISQLSSSGISGRGLSEVLNDLKISGRTATSAGYSTNIGTQNFYNATPNTLTAALTASAGDAMGG